MRKLKMTVLISVFVLCPLFFGLSDIYSAELEEAHEAYKLGKWNKAVKLYLPLVEKGCPEAANNLGELYARGLGVRRNYSRAMELFEISAEQGNAYAQTNLGLHYSQGLGARRDFSQAYKWFSLAAAQDNFLAQNALGLFYLHGRGVKIDHVKAFKWFSLSASQGFDQAEINRDRIETGLNPEELRTAEKLIKEFRTSRNPESMN